MLQLVILTPPLTTSQKFDRFYWYWGHKIHDSVILQFQVMLKRLIYRIAPYTRCKFWKTRFSVDVMHDFKPEQFKGWKDKRTRCCEYGIIHTYIYVSIWRKIFTCAITMLKIKLPSEEGSAWLTHISSVVTVSPSSSSAHLTLGVFWLKLIILIKFKFKILLF